MRDTLSRRFSDPTHQAGPDLVRWTNTTGARAGACDECIAQLWEQGLGAAPSHARTQRHLRDTRLFLCHPHAQLWKDRDRGE